MRQQAKLLGKSPACLKVAVQETFEFERLDSQSALPQGTGQAGHDAKGLWAADSEARWLALYAKHEGAWKAWMAQNRDERSESFNLY